MPPSATVAMTAEAICALLPKYLGQSTMGKHLHPENCPNRVQDSSVGKTCIARNFSTLLCTPHSHRDFFVAGNARRAITAPTARRFHPACGACKSGALARRFQEYKASRGLFSF